jgi:hypothetical protein
VSGVTEAIRATPAILKDIVHHKLRRALSSSRVFFDVSAYDLSATIQRKVLHGEESFSITRSFELQVIFDENDLYLAILPDLKLYNRLRLDEVLRILGPQAVCPPQHALCYTGEQGDEKWRDGEILAISSNGSVIVRVPSVVPADTSLPPRRVIPRLSSTMIRRILHIKRSPTRIDTTLARIRADGQFGPTNHAFNALHELRAEYIQPLFPLFIGQSQVDLTATPVPLTTITSALIQKTYHCVSQTEQSSQPFDSILEGLQQIHATDVTSYPVALICTESTRRPMEDLLHQLNDPSNSPGGFRGLPVHFGIRLEPLQEGAYVVDTVERYIEMTRRLVQSPNAEKRNALALICLSEEDETFVSDVPLYYRLKGLLASTGHASQMVDRQTLSNRYAHWNLALNLAAKLGGTPWTLQDRSALEPVDLFLGFSYSSIRPARLGQQRNIAYVNVFDSTGKWQIFCADSAAFSFEERFRIFPDLAESAVNTATDHPETLRLIEVHYNKRFGRTERTAIVDGIRRAAPEASILFVSVSDEHPTRLFSNSRPSMSADRGTVVMPTPDIAYLQSVDSSAGPGIPRPLRVQTYREHCREPETTYSVCERMLALTRLNWRSVRDYSSLPVTILYSSLVARLTNYFSLDDWSNIDHRLKRTPWFL